MIIIIIIQTNKDSKSMTDINIKKCRQHINGLCTRELTRICTETDQIFERALRFKLV